MKKTLLSLAAALTLTSAVAADVTYDISKLSDKEIKGTYTETTYKEDNSVKEYAKWQPVESITLGDYNLTFTGDATAPAVYTTAEGKKWTLRLYNSSSMTITNANGLKGIRFTTDTSKSFTGTASVGTGSFADKAYSWTAPEEGATSVTFSFTGTFRITEIVFSDEASVTPPETTPGFNVSFTTDMGGFTFQDGTLPEGLSYVWKQDSKYGLKATAYLDGTNYATDAWAISPVVDLTDVKEPVLNFRYAINMFKANNEFIGVAEAMKFVSVNVREENGEWVELTIPTIPTTQSWDFINSGDIDLSAYIGKKVQIGFRYISNATTAGTFEIDSASLSAKGSSVTPPVTPPSQITYDLKVNDAQEIDGTYTAEKPAEGSSYATAAHYQPLTSCLIGDYYFSFAGTSEKENQLPALYLPMSNNPNGNSNLRFYNGCSMTIEAPQGKKMTAIYADGSNADDGLTITPSTGNATLNSAKMEWKDAEGAEKVTFSFNKKIRFYGFHIVLANSDSVDGIEIEEGEAEYYNLQGVKVLNPENGLYIKVLNGKATKVIIRK